MCILSFVQMLLPSSAPRSPKYNLRHFEETLAVAVELGAPHLFITLTCNPHWKEMEDALTIDIGGMSIKLQPNERPDVVCRVFHNRLLQMVHFLKSGGLGHEVLFGLVYCC
jgi:hypothetical protein